MKKIKLLIQKFLVNHFGIKLKKQKNGVFVLEGTNIEIHMYPSVREFLRKHHKIHSGKNVEILIKPNLSLKNKLILSTHQPFQGASVYVLKDTSWTLTFCDTYLDNFFGQVPKNISYEVYFLK